jgi:catechol 2,3-dioxygenase
MDLQTNVDTLARGPQATSDTTSDPEFHPDVRIGHVHLRVADLARATAFYRDVLGFEVTAYGPDFGLPGASFLFSQGYHHHLGLNTWESEGGTPPPGGIPGSTTSRSSTPTTSSWAAPCGGSWAANTP